MKKITNKANSGNFFQYTVIFSIIEIFSLENEFKKTLF